MVDEIPLRAHARPLGEPNPTETPEFHFTPAPRPTGRGRFRARIRFEQHPQQGWHVQLTVNNDGRGKRTARPRVIGTRSRLRRTYRSGRILSACQALSARPGCSSFEWLQPPLFTPRSFRDPEAKPSPARNADREVRRGSPRPLGCGFASRASGTPTGRVATPSGRTDGPLVSQCTQGTASRRAARRVVPPRRRAVPRSAPRPTRRGVSRQLVLEQIFEPSDLS
jgi:hypothetical protein